MNQHETSQLRQEWLPPWLLFAEPPDACARHRWIWSAVETGQLAGREMQAAPVLRCSRSARVGAAMLRSGDLHLTLAAQLETLFAGAERQSRKAVRITGLGGCPDQEQYQDHVRQRTSFGNRHPRTERASKLTAGVQRTAKRPPAAPEAAPATESSVGTGESSGAPLGSSPRIVDGLRRGGRRRMCAGPFPRLFDATPGSATKDAAAIGIHSRVAAATLPTCCRWITCCQARKAVARGGRPGSSVRSSPPHAPWLRTGSAAGAIDVAPAGRRW